MILMIVIATNMFFDALFWQARYPTPDARPSFQEIVFFGIVGAVINTPAIMIFRIIYRKLGTKIATFEKHVLLGKHIIGDTFKDQETKLNNIKRWRDAVDYSYLINGALYYLKHDAKETNRMSLNCFTRTKKKPMIETPHKNHRRKSLLIIEELRNNPALRAQKLKDFHVLSSRAKSIVKELLKKKNTQKEKDLKRFKELYTPMITRKSCCSLGARYQIGSKLRKESKRLFQEEKIKDMSKDELMIYTSLKKRNCLVRKLFEINKRMRNPRMNVSPSPHWIRYLLDFFVVALVAFYCYFIVAFSFYYGKDVTRAWLQCFLTSMIIDMVVM
jgi:hypothetical protein